MKKMLILALTVVTGLVATSAFASISASKHNMNTSGYIGTGTQSTEICIYCHTPHNAEENVPIWNRTQVAGITNYDPTASPSIDLAVPAAVNVASISGKCLSCHDGSIAPSSVANSKVTATTTMIAGAAQLGTLENDHPVNFVYADLLDTNGPGGATSLVPILTIETEDIVKFFGATKTLECASCHAVHDDTETYFLRKDNDGSALCLTCHAK